MKRLFACVGAIAFLLLVEGISQAQPIPDTPAVVLPSGKLFEPKAPKDYVDPVKRIRDAGKQPVKTTSTDREVDTAPVIKTPPKK